MKRVCNLLFYEANGEKGCSTKAAVREHGAAGALRSWLCSWVSSEDINHAQQCPPHHLCQSPSTSNMTNGLTAKGK